MKLQQTLRNQTAIIMDMNSMIYRIATLKNQISGLEILMNDFSTNDTPDDRAGYQMDIVELEIELDMVTEIYNQKLDSLKQFTTQLRPLEV